MSERIDRFKYIGDIEHAADQTRELLSYVGLWDSHGKHFINGGVKIGRSPYCNLASHPFNHTAANVGFQQSDEPDTVYSHAKKSKEKMDEFYTPELLRKVNEVLYPDDYKLWNLVSTNGKKLSWGRDLMSKLSSKCKGTSLGRDGIGAITKLVMNAEDGGKELDKVVRDEKVDTEIIEEVDDEEKERVAGARRTGVAANGGEGVDDDMNRESVGEQEGGGGEAVVDKDIDGEEYGEHEETVDADNDEKGKDKEGEQEEEGWGDHANIEALQPISFEKCCIPAALKQKNNQSDVDCFGTCYTERACDDMIYPFNSVEEKKLFPSIQLTEEGRNIRRFECMSPKKLTPPVKWCQKPHRDTEKGTPAHLVKGIPPAGCSKSASSGGSGAFQHVIIFPSVKLAFCGIPKVGITMWEQFLRFYIGAKDYPSLPHYKLDRTPFQFDQLDPDAQRRIWEDEEWTWAAFVRNPAERLLSGYLDKVKSNEGRLRWSDGNLTFEAFIDTLSKPANLVTVFDDTGRQVISHKCASSNNSSLFGLTWCSDPRKLLVCVSHIAFYEITLPTMPLLAHFLLIFSRLSRLATSGILLRYVRADRSLQVHR